MIDIREGVVVCLLLVETRVVPTYCCLIDESGFDDGMSWYHYIYQFLIYDTYLEAVMAKDKRALRQLATHFVICGETLYRSAANGMLLLCLDRDSVDRAIMQEFVGPIWEDICWLIRL